jgi:hypothetical protein
MRWHRFVINCVAPMAALALFLFPCAGSSEENALIGTWKLKSFVREVLGTGERYNQLGERPEGVIGYSTDGRMYAIFVAGDRIKPRDDIPTDAERIELFKTMIAYSGTYTVDALKVVHHVDTSWNGARIGSDQVRFYTLEGDTLTIKTAPNKSPVDGREGVGVLVFQRIK